MEAVTSSRHLISYTKSHGIISKEALIFNRIFVIVTLYYNFTQKIILKCNFLHKCYRHPEGQILHSFQISDTFYIKTCNLYISVTNIRISKLFIVLQFLKLLEVWLTT